VQAIAAAARANLQMGKEFDYGFDGQFDSIAVRKSTGANGKTVERHSDAGFPIVFQLKCSWVWTADADSISWSIKTKAYNDLVTRDPDATGAILILMCLPTDPADWVTVTEESILMKRCCYFASLSGPPTSTEDSTKQIKIPRTNVLDAANLTAALAAERNRRKGLFT
jgi:hypothetical protein